MERMAGVQGALSISQVAVVQVDGEAQVLDVRGDRARGVECAQLLHTEPIQGSGRKLCLSLLFPSRLYIEHMPDASTAWDY